MEYIIGIVIGAFVSAITSFVRNKIHTFGNIEIDTSKDDKAIYRFNYEKDPFNIPNHKYIIFDVRKASLKSLDEDKVPVAKK